MTKLAWGLVGERYFEAGVDRGVLYVDGLDGVAWNGLTSVSESTVGGETTPYYIDGIMYLNRASSQEFEATIDAYTYPDEFAQCEGTVPVLNGLFMTNQKKKSFSLAYRTRVGNDVDGIEHGYKLHLVYDATAEPSARPNSTIGETLDADNFSWKITTKPPSLVTGYKPTSHVVIDSRETPVDLLQNIEDIIYGTVDDAPRMPSIPELIFLFNSYNTSVFDAGEILEPYYITFDGGPPLQDQDSTIDGGTP